MGTGNVETRLREPASIEDVKTTPIEVRLTDLTVISFIDEDRGFIPIETQLINNLDGRVVSKVVVTDIRRCSKERWFPVRCVAIWINGDEDNGNHSVREVVIHDLDVDKRPKFEQFAINLPKGTRVWDGTSPNSNLMLDSAQAVNLNSLEELHQRTQFRLAARSARAMPLSESFFVWITLAVLRVFISIILLVVVRLQRGRSRSSMQ
jgi:hypothetical protein